MKKSKIKTGEFKTERRKAETRPTTRGGPRSRAHQQRQSVASDRKKPNLFATELMIFKHTFLADSCRKTLAREKKRVEKKRENAINLKGWMKDKGRGEGR